MQFLRKCVCHCIQIEQFMVLGNKEQNKNWKSGHTLFLLYFILILAIDKPLTKTLPQ